MADQRLFGSPPPPEGGTSQAWAEAVTPYSSLPWVRGGYQGVEKGVERVAGVMQ